MNYAEIKKVDIANGPGVRVSLFVSGCRNHCKGCFNPETWDFGFGQPYTSKTEDYIVESLKPVYIKGLSILGGEPMEPANQKEVRSLTERVKREVENADIWIYSGYRIEELMDPDNKRCHTEDTLTILQNTDVLVDGEFQAEKKNIMLKFRGSSNQRIIDVPPTLENYRNGINTVVIKKL